MTWLGVAMAIVVVTFLLLAVCLCKVAAQSDWEVERMADLRRKQWPKDKR